MGWIWIWQDIQRNPTPPHLETNGNSMLFFHAYKGCNVRSVMFGIGKEIVWNALANFS
jgi:hypothetical protein